MYPLLVHPDIEELQSKLKEILYDCAVEVRATKAALYLYDQQDDRFGLITEYGFRGALRNTADRNDPVVDRSGRGRTAFFVNGLMAEPRFSEILYESATDRMLVAPIYLRGQLVGFVDMRDKAAKQAFETSDLPKAQGIANRVGELFATTNIFGHRFIQLSSSPAGEPAFTGVYSPVSVPGPGGGSGNGPAASTAAAPKPVSGAFPALRPVPAMMPAAAPVAAAGTAPVAVGRIVPRVGAIIAESQAATEALRAPSAEAITETELAIARDLLRLILLIPGAVAAAFAAGGVQEIAGKSAMGEDAIEAMQSRIDAWLQKRGETATFTKRNVVGAGTPPVSANDVQKVFTAPVNAGSIKGMYLTAAFAADPDRASHDLLASLHRQLQNAIEQSLQRRTSDHTRRRIAEQFLEPDFVKYPELRHHTECVAKRVDAFVKFLALSPAEIENARLLAIVHDAGMRLLEYDRLYRKRDLSHDELQTLRSHVFVGAALIEPLLGRDIARAVLTHHERWDGGGYPYDLHGSEIPLLARILQICDVYESMVGTDNYQNQKSHDQAMTVITRGAGIQFDPELANRFAEMMRSAR